MDIDLEQFLSLGLPIFLGGLLMVILLCTGICLYVRRTKERRRARRAYRREQRALRRQQEREQLCEATAATPSVNINVSIGPATAGAGSGGEGARGGGEMPPTYEEALRSTPVGQLAEVHRGRGVQRQPSDPPPPYEFLPPILTSSTPQSWNNTLTSSRATPISIISTSSVAPYTMYPRPPRHGHPSPSSTLDPMDLHQRSFSCPTPQSHSLVRGAGDTNLSAYPPHQRSSSSHDPCYTPESLRNVALNLYCGRVIGTNGVTGDRTGSSANNSTSGSIQLTHARSRSGLALSTEDITAIGLESPAGEIPSRQSTDTQREAQNVNSRPNADIQRQRSPNNVSGMINHDTIPEESSGTSSSCMIQQLLSEQFPGAHYGSVTPSRIGGRYGPLSQLTQQESVEDTERSIPPERVEQLGTSLSNRQNSSERGGCSQDMGRNNSGFVANAGELDVVIQVGSDNSNVPSVEVPSQQQQQQQQTISDHVLQQQQIPHQQQQHQPASLEEVIEDRHQPYKNDKSFYLVKARPVYTIPSRFPTPSNDRLSQDQPLKEASDLIYTYRIGEGGDLEVGVVHRDVQTPDNEGVIEFNTPDIPLTEAQNGDFILEPNFDASIAVQQLQIESDVQLSNSDDTGAIELQQGIRENGETFIYSEALDGGGLTGIYV